MKLEYLELKNFRSFLDARFDFDTQLTVFVGSNGSGKTTVLDALALYLEALAEKQTYHPNSYPGMHIKKTDKTLLVDENISYTIKFVDSTILGAPLIKLFFTESAQDDRLLKVDNVINALKVSDNLVSNAPKDEGLTILTYYGAQRCIPKDYDKSSAIKGRSSVFKNAFSANIDFQSSLVWFDEKDAEEARARSNNEDFTIRNSELTAVRDAIVTALGKDIYEYPHMDGVPPDLHINNKKTKIAYKVSQLSDGYKTMLALVMDLARRMAVANGELFKKNNKSVLESSAIVLIDEIELHLHPSWQQTVLPSLTKIFPNTQFIVSTHSPQVITSIEPEKIRILINGQVKSADTLTYGMESAYVLENIFCVPSRPNNEVKEALDAYLDLINENKHGTEEAIQLRNKLEKWISGDPVLTQASMFIRRNERHRQQRDNSDA